jgi:hypothetical protein
MFRYNYECDTDHQGTKLIKLSFTFKHIFEESNPNILYPGTPYTKRTVYPRHRTDCIISKFNGKDEKGKVMEEYYGGATVYCHYKDQFTKKDGCRWALKKAIESFPRKDRTEIWGIFRRMSLQGTCTKLVDGIWHAVSFNKLKKNDIFALKFGNQYAPGHHVNIAIGDPALNEDSHGNKIWGVEAIPLTLNNISSTFIKMVAEQFSPDEIVRMIAEA